ncbi:hypothetical protein HJB79_21345 [Rhizobium lentis]|uniref:hypothetical protein n=1 Tax=Rhizobium lentis TaxID=1138194 RepID=UPI001C83CEDC|nr:hypothetical protein [Rhizobium lentis]MBX5132555.1 hypothetical protein [Rhizobium lentis]MBX5141289.1 hypothetical protein [Rhizobium lentis]MBX5152274.1 hypothetical protein [Rhizobium lentis]MBX5180383.1 hypothetical protein [Rhizobium lentis]
MKLRDPIAIHRFAIGIETNEQPVDSARNANGLIVSGAALFHRKASERENGRLSPAIILPIR